MTITIDMSQFHGVFFEECFECLDAMESGLNALDLEKIDLDQINSIYRGAHTIKGGSATFGFNAAAEYAHTLETQLNDMRNGATTITPQIKDILLNAINSFRMVITDLQNKQDSNQDTIKHQDDLQAELDKLIQA
ncbi:MAG: Hpt domain-containing protein [Methylococcales bacterium]|nr:Hpt domain-containing protein [Methylococcales bacterium]